MDSLDVFCNQCRDLFIGEIERVRDSSVIKYRYGKRDGQVFPTSPPSNRCVLCYKTYLHLDSEYWTMKEGSSGAKKVTNVIMYRDLTLQRASSKVPGGRLEGEIYDNENESYRGEYGNKVAYSFSIVRVNWGDSGHSKAGKWERKVVDPTTNSEHTFTLAHTWLKTCTTSHLDCNLERLGLSLPSRLLALHSLGTRVNLLETCTITPPPSYMTLSHCWGKAQFFTLRTSTYKMLQTGIDVSILPRTFQDAIQIACRLGAKYMWIDSLCIIQDSKADWQTEAPLMASIYKGSTLNIGAAASRSSDEGCFRDRNPNMIRPILFTTSYAQSNFNNDYMIENDIHLDFKDEDKEPLFSRAWVFQERCLSPRMLSFGAEYVSWTCKMSRASEKHPDLNSKSGLMSSQQLISTVFSEDSKEKRLEMWSSVLLSYSPLSLTFSGDKLVAISGISRHLQVLEPSDKYIAGLWSWASIDGPIAPLNSHTTRSPDPAPLCTIKHITVHHATNDIYGEVLASHLVMEGLLLRCADFNMVSHLADSIEERYQRISYNLSLSSIKSRRGKHHHHTVPKRPDHTARSGRLHIEISNALHLDYNIGQAPLYFCPILKDSYRLHGILLRPAKEGYERCGILDISQDEGPEGICWGKTRSAAHRTWAEELEMRTKKRHEEEGDFDVNYLVGAPEEEENTEQGKAEAEWKEYDEFDGKDYTFRIY